MDFDQVMECDQDKTVSHDRTEIYAATKDQIIIALAVERINNGAIKEKAFQVNNITYIKSRKGQAPGLWHSMDL